MVTGEKIREVARKHAILAASKYGEAKVNSVVGKVVAELPEIKKEIKEAIKIIRQVVEEVNRLPASDIEELAKKYEKLTAKKVEERKWPPLPNVDRYDVVVTRFAPEPNGYLHLGHARAIIVSFVYARMYNGRFLLRIEDTNPRKERLEYYDVIKEDVQMILEATEVLGIERRCWDGFKIESYDMPLFYKYAEKLIGEGKAYVCTCDKKTLRLNRRLKKPCACRGRSIEENLELWGKMHVEFSEGQAHLRLKTSMNHPNPAMRDPGIFRIIEAEHPIQGDKYRVYPVYDFAVSVEDSVTGVTHAMRSKEFETHVEIQRTILSYLGLRVPEMYQFGRLMLENYPLSKRYLEPLVKAGFASWDDPRMPTLRGLFNRGIKPETIVQLIYDIGPGKTDSVVSWDNLEAYNRKIVDKEAERYHFVPNPVLMEIEGVPNDLTAYLPVHPSFPEKGRRKVVVRARDGVAKVYIAGEDAKKLKTGVEVRLKDLCNVEVRGVTPDLIRARYLERTNLKVLKIQWVPVENNVLVELFVPETPYSYSVKTGYGEEALLKAKPGSIVHLVRIGYGVVKGIEKGKVRLVFSHS